MSVCEGIALRNNVLLGAGGSEQIVEGDVRKQAGEEVKKRTSFLAKASQDRDKGVVQRLPRPLSGRKLRVAGSCEAAAYAAAR